MEDLASQRNIAIDREGYERAMEGQREKARAGSAFKGKAGRHHLVDQTRRFGARASIDR
jgi:alanyl-tRNA synthetase